MPLGACLSDGVIVGHLSVLGAALGESGNRIGGEVDEDVGKKCGRRVGFAGEKYS